MTFKRLMAVALVGLFVASSPAAPAAAGPAPAVGIQAVSCPTLQPYLATGYGPVKMCYRYSDTPVGLYGQAGNYSGITGAFGEVTGWLKVNTRAQWNLPSVRADDGHVANASVGSQLETAYGKSSWGVQYINNSYPPSKARFGAFNWVTGTFYPSSGWLSIAS
jgi:hypothetical protein